MADLLERAPERILTHDERMMVAEEILATDWGTKNRATCTGSHGPQVEWGKLPEARKMQCSSCLTDLDPHHYVEVRAEIHDGPLAPTKIVSIGYLCLECLDGYEPRKIKLPASQAKRRGRKPKPKLRQPCGCGCGELTRPGKEYLPYHAPRKPYTRREKQEVKP